MLIRIELIGGIFCYIDIYSLFSIHKNNREKERNDREMETKTTTQTLLSGTRGINRLAHRDEHDVAHNQLM